MFNNDCDFDYVARFPGTSGYGAAICDDSHPKWKKEIAKTLADWVKRGATVERVPRSVASAGLREFVTSKQGCLLPVQANTKVQP